MIPSEYLCISGDAWFDQQAGAVQGDFLLVFNDKFGAFCARADNAQPASENVPELRQFINMGAAKKAAHTRDALIMFVRDLQQLAELAGELSSLLYWRDLRDLAQ